MHLYPITAVTFAWLFGSLSTAYAFREDWTTAIITIMAILFGIWVLISWAQMRGVAIVLAIAISATGLQAQAPPPGKPQELGCAGVAVAVVVVVVGAVVAVKIIKFCQKKFPKDKPKSTNAPPDELVFANGPSVDSAGLQWDELGSCACSDQSILADDPRPITTVSLHLRVDRGESEVDVTVTPLSMIAHTGPEWHQGWTEMADWASGLGLSLSGHAGSYSFARDGSPITAGESPISFSPRTKVVRVNRTGASAYTVVVERSPDMVQWLEVLRVEVEAGTVIEMLDTNPAHSQFYRYGAFLSD